MASQTSGTSSRVQEVTSGKAADYIVAAVRGPSTPLSTHPHLCQCQSPSPASYVKAPPLQHALLSATRVPSLPRLSCSLLPTRLPIPCKARSNHHDLCRTARCDRCPKVTPSSSNWQCYGNVALQGALASAWICANLESQ